MKARRFANIGCWVLIFPLVAFAILYVFWIWHIWGGYEAGTYDDHSYTDTVAFMLSYLTPVAVVGVVGLSILWRYGLATKVRVIEAAAASVLCSVAPFIFDLWLCHRWNVHFDLSYWAWWL
jgi:hypothetical protein